MSDAETLAIYDAKATEYAKLTASAAREPDLLRFINLMPTGGHVLDLGCGPGGHAATMADAGLQIDAWDASSEMVALAGQTPGVTARQASFDDLDAQAHYHGIWANFSLLHADPDRFDTHLLQALTPGGYFHIGMKTGTGTHRDPLGRRYTYVTAASLTASLAAVGLGPVAQNTGEDLGLDGVMAEWITVLSRKD